MQIPRLYPILDAGVLAARQISIEQFAGELASAGVSLLQYRDKAASPQATLANLQRIRSSTPGVTLLLNDRPDLARIGRCDGVHVGQTDLHPDDARRIVGAGKLIGVSTHTFDQFEAAVSTEADYLAIGPIYATATKQNPDPVTGLALLRQVRKLTQKPIVAIGGITSERALEVLDAGADSVAVISALVPAGPELSALPLVEVFLSAVMR
ncbi:thiamine phosphate synthase [Terriglobus albidus]|uniref:thiamine phosphate synthase n=1 Tax=Terriglobus albidus TaxID=1592106 RepID=UPI0021DFA115|nr:thiamine phosphate synthase [Terriglobus albidus]